MSGIDDAAHEVVVVEVERVISGNGVTRLMACLAIIRGLPRVILYDTVDSTSCPIVGLLLTVVGPRSDVQDVASYSYYVDTDESGCRTDAAQI